MFERSRPAWFTVVVVVLLASFAIFSPASIIQAIVPQAVPTVNRQGSTGTTFFICNGVFVNGNLVSSDSNGNCVDAGTAASPGGGLITYSSDGGLTITTNTYFFPFGGGGAPSTVEGDEKTLVNSAGLVSQFGVQISTALGMGNTGVFTIRDNGVNTAVTCTITGAAAVTCSDTTHSFNTTAGHTYTVGLVTTGTIVVTPSIQMVAQFGSVTTAPVTSVFGKTGTVNIPVTTTDISTPAAPGAGTTIWYTKAGKFCSESPAAVENCTGASGGSAASPIIQSFASQSGFTLAAGQNTVSGNLLVLSVCTDTNPTTVTDTQGNTWTEADNVTHQGVQSIWYTTAGSSAADTITANGPSTDVNCRQMQGLEAKGFSTLDAHANNNTGVPLSLTTVTANDLVVVGVSNNNNGRTFANQAPTMVGPVNNGDGSAAIGWFTAGAAGTWLTAIQATNGGLSQIVAAAFR